MGLGLGTGSWYCRGSAGTAACRWRPGIHWTGMYAALALICTISASSAGASLRRWPTSLATRAAAPCPPTLTPPTATRWARRRARWWLLAAPASWPQVRKCCFGGPSKPAQHCCCGGTSTCCIHTHTTPALRSCHRSGQPGGARQQVDCGRHPAAVHDAPGAPLRPVSAAAALMAAALLGCVCCAVHALVSGCPAWSK